MPKTRDTTDLHVGKRVRARRIELGLSQTALGDSLKVSFQQVQKYEKGINRLGAGRLQRLCTVLKVPMTYFFEGGPNGGANGEIEAPSIVTDLLATGDGFKLVRAFTAIKETKTRRAVVRLVEQMAARD